MQHDLSRSIPYRRYSRAKPAGARVRHTLGLKSSCNIPLYQLYYPAVSWVSLPICCRGHTKFTAKGVSRTNGEKRRRAGALPHASSRPEPSGSAAAVRQLPIVQSDES
jgi:hypothetical protein